MRAHRDAAPATVVRLGDRRRGLGLSLRVGALWTSSGRTCCRPTQGAHVGSMSSSGFAKRIALPARPRALPGALSAQRPWNC